MRELTRRPSNFRSQSDLDSYLKAGGITGIEGIDTRAARAARWGRGAMNGVVSTTDLDDASLVRKARACPNMDGSTSSARSCRRSFEWDRRPGAFAEHVLPSSAREARRRHRLRHEVEHPAA